MNHTRNDRWTATTDMKQAAVHEWDPEHGVMRPVWLLIESQSFDWSGTLEVRLEAPLESFAFDELGGDALSLAVPDHVYMRHDRKPGMAGIAMPMLAQYAERIFAVSPQPPLVCDITRLLLRISDIEDMLLYEPNGMRKRNTPMQTHRGERNGDYC